MQVQAPPRVNIGAETMEQACSVACSAIHHLLFAKGQVQQPIAVLRKQSLQAKHAAAEGSQRRSTAFSLKRDERRREEMLKGLDRLQRDLLSILQIAIDDRRVHEAVILLRMGQSPSTSAKQQYFLILRGLADLGRDDRESVAPSAKSRQPFGVKTASTAASRSAALERKLVRFLLTQSGQESQLGRALNTDLGPTRTQVFLSMHNVNSAPPGWTHKRSLNRGLQQIEQDIVLSESANEVHPIDSGTRPRPAEEDIDTLVQALSPLKRRVLKSPEAREVRKSQEPIAPLRFSIGASNDTLPPVAIAGVPSSELTDLDFKRLARRRTRVAGSEAGSGSRPVPTPITRRRTVRRKGPISGAFIINFGATDCGDDPEAGTDRFEDRSWLGSNVILRSYNC